MDKWQETTRELGDNMARKEEARDAFKLGQEIGSAESRMRLLGWLGLALAFALMGLLMVWLQT